MIYIKFYAILYPQNETERQFKFMEEVKKIQKIGKVVKIVTLILGILTIVGCGVGFFGALILAVVPGDWLQISVELNGSVGISSSLSVFERLVQSIAEDLPGGVVTGEGNSLLVEFGSGEMKNIPLTKLLALAVFVGALTAAVYGVVFLLISKFGKMLEKNSSPFCKPCIRYLKVTAFLLLAWSVLSVFTGKAALGILFGSFMLGVSWNASGIFVSLVLLLVAYIFEYGAKLQKDADETL